MEQVHDGELTISFLTVNEGNDNANEEFLL